MAKYDSPGVHVPPPLIFAAAFVLGLGVQKIWPEFVWPLYFELPGLAFLVVGLSLMFVSVGVFWSRKTTILPNKSATEFVVVGPYRFTRNPMYLGMSLAYTGLSFSFGPVVPFLLLPVAVLVIGKTVIEKEEAYLSRRFGDSYEEYCKRVRRWI